MNSELIDTIGQIEPTGPAGFEGLVAHLLEVLTGRRFHLARSGSQAGRDMSVRYTNANVVAVECKRYGRDTEFNERELQGELTQAVMSIPDLDLWVLVASQDVPSQLHEALYQQARRESIEFLSISAGDGELSSLEALYAQSPKTVIAHVVEPGTSDKRREELAQAIKEIAAHPQFAIAVEDLREKFLSPLIGYDNWRSAQNQWVDRCLASEVESHAHFGQPLNVGEPAAALVPRESAWARLDEWISSWKETRETFVMLGEEGDGKTWAVASWLDQNVQNQEDFSAVVFLSSRRVDSNEPLSLLSGVISRRLPTLQAEDWARRLHRWTGKPADNAPRLLLVLDGINERGTAKWWRELVDQLAGSPWRDSVALLITCRTTYWQRYFENLRYLQTVTYTLPPYDDEELDTALAHHDLSRSDIPDELLPLIRKPRYFDLMVKHRERMAESGDVTVPRLVYEDWRDRLQRKGLELDEDAFRSLLEDLASAYLDGQDCIRERDLDNLLPSYYKDKRAIVEELRTGGILKAGQGYLQVDERRLVYGFGLLLVDQIRKEATTSDQDWEEVIAEWIEPQAETGIKARICEFAALHALSLPELPQKAKVALLNTWVGSHNPGEEAAANFAAYFPIDPSCYMELAEVVWSDVTENPWAQDLLMSTLLRWRDLPGVTPQLQTAFERWLGLVHLYGVSYQRGETEEDAEKLRQEICGRVNLDLEPGPFTLAERALTATEDDGLLRLGRAALAVISHILRGPFVSAIATGCVAEAVMGTPAKYDLFKWVMSTAPQSVWAEVEQEVEKLLETDHIVTRRAAYRLLSFEGSNEANALQSTLPNNLFPTSPSREAYKKDPCTSIFPWNKEVCEACLRRDDLPPRLIAIRSTHHSLNPSLSVPEDLETRLKSLLDGINFDSIWSLLGPTSEDIAFDQYELSLCAFAPQAIAGLVRDIVGRADQREGMSLRQLAWRLQEHYLIFEEKEEDSTYRAWKGLYQAIDNWNQTQQEAEQFLFGSVLKGLEACQQFDHLLERPDDAPDLATYESSFLPLEDWQVAWNELDDSQNTKRRQRALWFLSAHPEAIPGDCISRRLAPFLDHQDSLIRSSVLKIAYVTKNQGFVTALLENGWSWSSSFCDLENHWGNLLLCEHGGALTYSELRSRVHPSYLGYAVKCRGLKDQEVNRYAEDIHRIWSRIGTETPDLPADFPAVDIEGSEDVTRPTYRSLSPSALSRSITFFSRNFVWGGVSEDDPAEVFKSWNSAAEERRKLAGIAQQAIEEQVEAGNLWFAKHFHADAFERVLEMRLNLVSEWVDFALADSDDAIRRIRLARSFYDGLCAMLLNREPSIGTRLYKRLVEVGGGITVRDALSKIRLLDYALFEAPATSDVHHTWRRRLEQCTTDQELMQVAIVAQRGNGQDWLQSYIDQQIHSSAPLEKSRAFTLLAFMEAEESSKLLNELLETQPDTWAKDLLKKSLRRWQINAWAKHWFERFLTAEDDVAAWAAFRLFLHCADSRFWLWQPGLQSEVGSNPQLAKRVAFCKDNLHTIWKRIRKNEESLSKHLFGQKTKPNQAWPWM